MTQGLSQHVDQLEVAREHQRALMKAESRYRHAAEGDQTIGAAPIVVRPHAHLDAVLEMDLSPLVTVARVGEVGMHAEVPRCPLPIDPSTIAVDLLVDVAPRQGAGEADVAVKI